MLRGRLNRAPSPAGPAAPGLTGQVSEAGPAPQPLIDLPHERLGTGQVGEREVNAGELDPRLNSKVGQGVGQQVPQPLSADELLARRRDISPVHGGAGPAPRKPGAWRSFRRYPAWRKTAPAWSARTSALATLEAGSRVIIPHVGGEQVLGGVPDNGKGSEQPPW